MSELVLFGSYTQLTGISAFDATSARLIVYETPAFGTLYYERNGSGTYHEITGPIDISFSNTSSIRIYARTPYNDQFTLGDYDLRIELSNASLPNGGAGTTNDSGTLVSQINSGSPRDFIGDDSSEIIFGDGDSNTIFGFGGNDTIIGGAGADTIDGGNDTDTLSYIGSSTGVVVSLSTGYADGGDATGDVFSNLENLTGSDFADTLVGKASAVIDGGAGADFIVASGGLNLLSGGLGEDLMYAGGDFNQLNGGAGDDDLGFGKATAPFSMNISTGNVFDGGTETDTFVFETFTSSYITNLSTGVFSSLVGSFFNTLTNIENISAGSGDDLLTGDSAANVIRGGGGGDIQTGNGGNDTFDIRSGEADGDFITDFSIGDRIATDFSSFVGSSAFTGASGQLRYEHIAGDTRFLVDNDGDMTADETFFVNGIHAFFGTPAEIRTAAFRDFAPDGTSDLMFQSAGGTTYSRLDGPTTGSTPTNEDRSGFTSIGLADIDGDGVLDNVIRAANNNYVIQFSGENTGASTVGGNAFDIVGFADLDGDGADEALATSTNPADERLYIADDALTTLTRIGFNAQTPIGFGDFDGDGADEILIEQSSGGKRLYDDGLGVISVGKARLVAEAIGDFNGDGMDDVLTRHPNKNNHFFLVEGDETTPLETANFIGFQSLILVATGDFDGDGKLDILGNQNGTSFQMLTNGLTTLTAINFGNDTFEAIGDFNGDGSDDILLQRPNEQGRIVYSGDRNDTALIDALIGKSVRDVADYDGDGSDDLLVQDDVDGSYSILLSGVGSEIELDASLDDATVIDPNGLDTLGLV